ncbi:MAG: 6-phosphogluconolactonase [Oligoflexia bacterium]|nr:6-phosphogluconolactonase [Oligoflexia bacterium]
MKKIMVDLNKKQQIFVAKNYNNLCKEVTEKIYKLSEKGIKENGCFTIVLSGGSTPQGIYLLMANDFYRNKFQWKFIHFFWGDERCVPICDPNSNYRMISDILLTKIDIPRVNIHEIAINTNNPTSTAHIYESELISYFNLSEKEFPRFDLILLGLGSDGHTASLFPQSSNIFEDTFQLVISTVGGEPNLKRITLTIPVLNNAKNLIWIVSGSLKAQIVKKALENNVDDIDNMDNKNLLPKHVLLKNGNTFWFLDRDASCLLNLK